MTQQSVPTAKLFAACTLTLYVGMLGRVVTTGIVSPSEDERAQIANVSTVGTLGGGDCLYISVR